MIAFAPLEFWIGCCLLALAVFCLIAASVLTDNDNDNDDDQ